MPSQQDRSDRWTRRPLAVAAVIALLCLGLTAASTWAAARVDRNTEHRLLQVQTNQAATVLSTAIMLIQTPLSTALSVQKVAGPRGDTSAFANLMSSYVGKGKMFGSASLWQRHGDRFVRLGSTGPEPTVAGRADIAAELRQAFATKTYSVRSLHHAARRSVGYAQADPASNFAVYAERAIPADRRAPVDRDSSFHEIHYAIYLGRKVDLADLSTTDVAPATLPLGGITARATVPFGNTVLTLVTSRRHHLGAPLSRRLPLILLLGGLLLTLGATAASHQLTRGRRTVERLYGQQRELSERLQRALLPQAHPTIPNLEVAAEYVAGAQGVDIGGDWYSIIGLDDGRYAFVVGDVSGRGIDAVAVMARARFTIRAYLSEGHSPADTLEKCSRQFDITADGHMTTALVGVGDWRTGEVTIANAGHPSPLLMDADGAEFVTTVPGGPLGTGPTTYESTTFTMAPGTTLLCFTDGLVERRTEDIDVGMSRLVTTASQAARASTQALVHHAVHTLRNDDAPDDVAVLAMRWSGAR